MIFPAVYFDCDAASSYFELCFSLLIGTLHGSSFDSCILGRHFEYVTPLQYFDYDTSWNSFDWDIHWKYFCFWNFLAVLWIVILACNTFIVVFSDSTLDMSVILSGSPFVLTLPGSTTLLKSF